MTKWLTTVLLGAALALGGASIAEAAAVVATDVVAPNFFASCSSSATNAKLAMIQPDASPPAMPELTCVDYSPGFGSMDVTLGAHAAGSVAASVYADPTARTGSAKLLVNGTQAGATVALTGARGWFTLPAATVAAADSLHVVITPSNASGSSNRLRVAAVHGELAPAVAGFPNPSTTGVPAGWTPTTTINGDYTVSTPGAVVQDVRVNGGINVTAPNVTLRRVDVVGGSINNWPGATCQNGLLLEDVTVERGASLDTTDYPAILQGGYTARRVKIWERGEGFRVGGKSGGCGPVSISDSFVKIVAGGSCADVHSDGLQGYDGAALTISNTTIDFNRSGPCEGAGTSPFFYPGGAAGNTSADVNGLLVMGGGINFRDQMPGTVTGLDVVDGSWFYGPLDVACPPVTWGSGNEKVTIDSNYQVTGHVGALTC